MVIGGPFLNWLFLFSGLLYSLLDLVLVDLVIEVVNILNINK